MDIAKERQIYLRLVEKGFDRMVSCAILANLYCESAYQPNNLQSNGNKKLCMTDQAYTDAVDSGDYTKEKFIKDGFGYGLAQWTYHTRKKALYEFAKKRGTSIGDLETQVDFLSEEIKGYSAVMQLDGYEHPIGKMVEVVMCNYEKPKDQSEAAILKRTSYADAIVIRNVGNFNKKSNLRIAVEVITGHWGNGQARKERLEEEGYCYSDIQCLVNELLELKEEYKWQ